MPNRYFNAFFASRDLDFVPKSSMCPHKDGTERILVPIEIKLSGYLATHPHTPPHTSNPHIYIHIQPHIEIWD